MLVHGGIAAFGNVIILLGTLFCVFLSNDYLEGIDHNYNEVYGMILFATSGMICLAGANDLISLFLGLETMSICLYVMAGLIKMRSKERKELLSISYLVHSLQDFYCTEQLFFMAQQELQVFPESAQQQAVIFYS